MIHCLGGPTPGRFADNETPAAGRLNTIRIYLLGMPRMLRSLVRDILEREVDMEIVGETATSEPAEILATDPNMVIVGMESADLPPAGTSLLSDLSKVRVLGLSPQGRSGYLYELRPRRQPVGEVSPQSLVKVIREGQG
jgi:hypothetical protein